MKSLFLIYVSLIGMVIIPDLSSAQSQLPDAAYLGGTEALASAIRRNIKYPKEARENNIFGTLVIYFQVSPDGKLTRMEFLNKIGYGFEDDIVRLFTQVLTDWVATGSTNSYILPFSYSMEINYLDELDIAIPENCLTSIIIIGYGSSRERTEVSHVKKMRKKLDKFVADGSYQESLEILTRLIAIDPFDKELYLKRIEVVNAMESEMHICYDYNTLYRLFGVELEEEIKKECGL